MWRIIHAVTRYINQFNVALALPIARPPAITTLSVN